MNVHLKKFLHRGLVFAGFGPVVCSTVFFIISSTTEGFSLNATDLLVATLSTYILAFVHAGASVFNQIEGWSVMKSTLAHFATLYVAYTVCYLINSWISLSLAVICIYTGVFVLCYLAVWAVVMIILKITEKRLNAGLK